MKVPEPRKLPSGAWFIQLRLSGISIPVTASSPKECTYQAQLIKAEYKAGKREIQATGGSLTLTKAIDRYISDRQHSLSESTIDGYRRIQKNHFPTAMKTPMGKIKNWQALCDAEARTYAPKTVRNAYMFIASVLRENGIAAPRVKFPSGKSKPREWLDPDEIELLVATVADSGLALPTLLALHSLRRSEIAALDWSRIDLGKGTIAVRGAVVQNEKHKFVERKANKSNASTRTVPIMIPELRAALESVKPEKRTGKVITYSPHTICNRINAACRCAGLPEVGTHGLRHSFASLAYHLGMSELETMEIGGWDDASTMHKIYTHLAAADRLKAENKMANFYKNANKNANGTQKVVENQAV